ncbi:DNA ligase 4 [Geodia barretti]|uniref:DNA ligase n=1 Tax=Geodia barretti TaxID=519541 RepID=A0AA35RGW4_GEOBA|nr:DNA ligase 4 [Geodia barretti]
MLGQRATIDQVMKLMDNGPFYLETKFDGDRIQLHRQGNSYRYFSRSSKDYTTSFGASPYEGSFTPMIHDAFNSKVKGCILDGEMVGWDAETEIFLPKGDHVDVKTIGRDEDSGIGIQQCFVVFDVLMVNDTNFANRPLSERAEQLKKVFEPVKGYIHLVHRRGATTKEEVVTALNEAIDQREEGLLVKNPASTYCPDKRKGSGWVKIKPEYVDSLSDQLDVLIIGGYFGEGRRAGMVSHFLCGVAVPPGMPGDKPSIFQSFCKVGSGYTLTELRDLGLKLKPHWQKFDGKRVPDCLALPAGSREKPDVWIPPSKSCIVQIRAAEIVTSERYRTGCTLRFPRVEKVRADKEYFDCMTTDELEQLKNMASGRLAHSHYDDEADGGVAPGKKKRRALGVRVERPKGVAANFRPTDTSDIQEVSSMFGGREFCVVNGTRDFSKEEMEKKIVEHGGCLVQNPGSETYCVLVARLIVRASSIISTGLYDVVKASWLSECLYGDSYTDDVTEEGLREIFMKVAEIGGERLRVTREEIAEMESRYFPNSSPGGLFRQCKVYLDRYSTVGKQETAIEACPLELTGLELQMYGAEVARDFDETVTHVVFDKDDLRRIPELRRLERNHAKKHHFVTMEWVRDSIECEFMKNERLYEPNV